MENLTMRRLLIFLVLILSACRSEKEKIAKPAVASTPLPAVEISFWGLTAFFPPDGNGNVWAFLVDADYEQGNCKPGDLPPGVDCSMEANYPPHQAWLAYDNADVDGPGCPTVSPKTLELFPGESFDVYPLQGAEIKVMLAGPIEDFTLDELVSDEEIHQATYYKAKPDLSSGPLSGDKLTARVEIIPGDVGITTYSLEAIPVPPNEGGVRRFSFCYGEDGKLKDGSGNVIKEYDLGEETRVTSTLSTPIQFKIDNQICTFNRESFGKTMRIWLLNVVDDEFASGSHPQAFRWLYHLVGQAEVHYYPCDGEPKPVGGRRCPELELQP